MATYPSFTRLEGQEKVLTDEQVAQYHKDGFLIVENFFTEEEVSLRSSFILILLLTS
tara:strand:- start:434 stop:604 length:171 start_codon:yes stop_codon:yes gene_type:complete